MAIKKESQRVQRLKLQAGKVQEVFFTDTKPSIFQVRNYANGIIYMSTNTQLSDANYEINIMAGGTRVYSNPRGTQYIYLYCAVDAEILLTSFESDEFYPADLDQTQESVIMNNTVTPVVSISGFGAALPAGANNIGKVNTIESDLLMQKIDQLMAKLDQEIQLLQDIKTNTTPAA
jgi:hypothetical protein